MPAFCLESFRGPPAHPRIPQRRNDPAMNNAL